MIAYCDTSSLATIVLRDEGWSELVNWIDANRVGPTFSDFGWGELLSAISMRVRRAKIDVDRGQLTIMDARVLTAGWSDVKTSEADIATATEFVGRFDLKLSLPDAIRIAIARRLSIPIVTGDRRQADAASAIGIPVHTFLPGDITR